MLQYLSKKVYISKLFTIKKYTHIAKLYFKMRYHLGKSVIFTTEINEIWEM